MLPGKRAVDEIAAAKAKSDSLRERLAARRQQRHELIAQVSHRTATAVGQPSTAANFAALLGGKMSTCTSRVVGNKLASTPVTSIADLSDKPISPCTSRSKGALATPASTNQAPPSNTVEVLDNCDTNIPRQIVKQAFSTLLCSSVASSTPVTVIASKSKTVARDNKSSVDEMLESLLSAETAKERELKRVGDEIMDLLSTPSTMEKIVTKRFKSQGGSQVQLFCVHGTRSDCLNSRLAQDCKKLHFRKIIHTHTDESLGDCSFLNTCFHVETCKYVHYEIDPADLTTDEAVAAAGAYKRGQLCLTTGPRSCGVSHSSSLLQKCKSEKNGKQEQDCDSRGLPRIPETLSTDTESPMYAAQWINCDIRQLDMTVLGKFAVIMADPPWDIHMELPYGTMSDDEMRRMDIPCLQDDGYIFLWVTGRAMELGRECLHLWGYERCDELIWVKTNQLQRLIRTGRTGHWLNHGKEHCLIGVKGNPQCMNRGLDCDVIVSEVRETSRKPDEIYGIIERLSPGTRKLELFGRPHNLQANWLTLGNQLDGTYLIDPAVVERYRNRYPNGANGIGEKSHEHL